jgi:hypothetical protein
LLSVNNEIIRRIGLQEALEMVATGEAIRISGIKAKKLVVRLNSPRRSSLAEVKGVTITFAEVQANAGLRGRRLRGRGRETGNFVDRAMAKIQIWPYVGDTLAIRVGPKPPRRYVPADLGACSA